MAKITKDDILEAIKEMPALELSELVSELEEVFGVSAAAPVAVAAAGGAPGAGGEAAEEEKDAFDVVLTDAGDKKIQVIKAVRSLPSLGLKEATAVVEEAPKPGLDGATKEAAEKAKAEIEEAGGSAELQ